MSDVVERVLSSFADDIRLELARISDDVGGACESPIEQIMGISLLFSFRLFLPNLRLMPCWPEKESEHAGSDTYLLLPQFPWNGYRIDWVLKIPKLKQPYLFIECDGHDFHERTKEQAERDRSKDRLVQLYGVPILRFTGREIYRDATACVAQVLNFIKARTDGENDPSA
jgi:very-short-patch-repair endonuclease